MRDGDLLITDTTRPGSAGIAAAASEGVLVVWIELAEQRPFTDEDQTLLPCWPVGSARVCSGSTSSTSSARPPWRCSTPSSARPLPPGSRFATNPRRARYRSGGDWYDVVDLHDGRIGLIVGDCVGHGLGRGDRHGSAAQRLPRAAAGEPRPA